MENRNTFHNSTSLKDGVSRPEINFVIWINTFAENPDNRKHEKY